MGEAGTGATESGRAVASPVAVLDERLHVTTSRSWLIFAGVVVLIVAGLVWAVVGRAPTEVRGRSILLPPEGLYEVGIGEEGFVEELLVEAGDSVREGDALARVVHADGRTTDVEAPVGGTVVSLLVKRGSYTRAGTPVVTIEPQGSDLLGVLFVPASDGKRVEPGMRVYLSPSTAPSAQYGSMLGRVADVSEVPVTSARLEVTVGENRPLIEFLSGQGPVLEVAVELERDASTASGYAWTSGDGPPFEIASATLGTGVVVLEERSPASQVFG